MKESHSVTQVICGALAAAQQLTEQVHDYYKMSFIKSISFALGFIDPCYIPCVMITNLLWCQKFCSLYLIKKTYFASNVIP